MSEPSPHALRSQAERAALDAPPAAGDPPAVVDLEGVRVAYGNHLVVDVDRLAVRPGELLVVIGPNGSGKSTLLRILGLLEIPTAGSVRFRGQLVPPSERLLARRQMASAFQDPLLVDATVFDNVALGLRFRGRPRDEIAARVKRWMGRFGIEHLAARRARTLSGGEAQRTALARALVLQPALLLLDEPFSALDQPTREGLIADLAEILRHDRTTAVLVTHDRGEAMALADRVAAMFGGRLLQVDEASRVFRAPASEAVARFVGVETIVDARVVAAGDGHLTLDVAGQTVTVAASRGQAGDRVLLCIRPEDLTLCVPGELEPAGHGNAPGELRPAGHGNSLAGRLTRLLPSGAQVRALIDCGVPLVALIAHRAAEEKGLVEGRPVVARFEASAGHIIPRSV